MLREGIYMKKILVPVDGSEISMRAVEVAKTMAQAFGSQIVLISVSGEGLSGEYIGGEDLQRLIEESKVYAEKNIAKAKTALGDLAAKSESIVKTGDPANEILDYFR
jgi:nucleotide-binding universal stress UspA family protein